MLRSLHLLNVGPAEKMEFEPNTRLNLVTGDNGLGKSFLLDLAWWAITRTWSGTPIAPTPRTDGAAAIEVAFAAVTKTASLGIDYDRLNQNWRFPKGAPGQPGLVVYARVDGDFAIWDSNRRFGDRDEMETDVPKGLVFSREQVWNGYLRDGRPICNGLLSDWTSWQQTRSWEAAALAQTLQLMSPAGDVPITPGSPVRTDVLDSRLIPTLVMPYGQEVPVTHASAGMKRILALAYLLVWTWREHLEVSRLAGRPSAERMLVIIDEIEAHLHPKWQRLILSSIVQALDSLTSRVDTGVPNGRRPDIQFIVATHSPLVLASLEPLFDAKTDDLFELHLTGDGEAGTKVRLDRVPFRRLGGAENWLLSDAFGLTSSRSIPAERAIREASEMFDGDRRPSRKMIEQMRVRLSLVLPEIDSFWTRWDAIVEARR